MVSLTIDGKKVEVNDGTTVLKAAQGAGVDIPTLCNHPSLVPYGGCRLCLVEVEGMRTLQPSCTLPASNNMVVHTDTEKVSEARKFVLSLIFSERNHFCMYCQVSGGDCELQNAAYHEEMTHWPIQPNFQKYPVDGSHPDFVLDNNRCILCRRCVRGCGELVGAFTLGIEERGSRSMVVADLGTPLGESSCVSCGTCVQLCPTGALIDRHSAYYGREKDVDHTQTICTACSVGCSTTVISREGHVLRIEGDWDGNVNQGILCRAGRFLPLYEERERILTPLVRKNGSLKAATWDEAVKTIAQHFQSAADKAALVSPRLPAESLYAFQQLGEKAFKTQNIGSTDEGYHWTAASRMAKVAGTKFEGSLDDVKTADCYLVIGTDLVKDHQVLGFFIKRNLPLGSKLIVIDSGKDGLNQSASVNIHTGKAGFGEQLAGIAVQLAAAKKSIPGELTSTDESEEVKSAAEILNKASHLVILYGDDLAGEKSDKAFQAILRIADLVSKSRGTVSVLSPKGEANSYASYLYGLEKSVDLGKGKSIFLALADEDISQTLTKRLEGCSFLAVQASYISSVTAMADVVLPVHAWAERSGHYLNLDGRFQVAEPAYNAKDGILSTTESLQKIAMEMGVNLDNQWENGLNKDLSLTTTLD